MVAPSLNRGNLLAKRVSCQNQLRALGVALYMYQNDYGSYVPIGWQNMGSHVKHPWKSWRSNLLPYTGFKMFNCPAARDSGTLGAVFHSDAEVLLTVKDKIESLNGTTNAGSYGIMYQYSLPNYKTINFSGIEVRGHPSSSSAFSTLPGVSWRDPANSVYAADAAFTYGPLIYPTRSYKNLGTSYILPPSEMQWRYFEAVPVRRFADRHCGTNCLFVAGYVVSYSTDLLDNMVAGRSDCVWDTE